MVKRMISTASDYASVGVVGNPERPGHQSCTQVGNLCYSGTQVANLCYEWPWMAPQACIQSTGSDGIGGLAAAVAARLPMSRSQIASK